LSSGNDPARAGRAVTPPRGLPLTSGEYLKKGRARAIGFSQKINLYQPLINPMPPVRARLDSGFLRA
jgi:hypothetical protein